METTVALRKEHYTLGMGKRIRHGFATVLGLALVTGLTGFLPVVAPAYACACGAFAPSARDGVAESISMDSESSIVYFADGQETIEMRLSVDSITSDTGLIFPTPAPGKASLGDAARFAALRTEMTPEQRVTDDWWSFPNIGLGTSAPGSANKDQGPSILDQVQLGPIQATTLAASDADGLTAWLDANGYGLNPEVTALLSQYVDKGWYFVAFKLTGSAPLDGELDPLRITFAATEPVYPLALSKAAKNSQYVYLYVFSDHKMTASFPTGNMAYLSVEWARSVHDPELQKLGPYLTALVGSFANPATQIDGDLTLAQARDDVEVGTVVWSVNYIRLGFLPMGWALVLISLGVLAVAVIIVRNLTRRRQAA